MRAAGGKVGSAGAALAALFLLASASRGQPPGSIPPVYTQRLQIPVRADGLEQPRAVVADLYSGEVLVCDTLRNRIVIFDPQGRFRYEIPGGSAFQSPVDLAVDPAGFLFVLSQVSSEIALLDFDGRFIRKTALTGLPQDIERTRFVSLAISPRGDRLYLIDAENDRLWITDRDGVIHDSVDLTVGRPQKEIDELRYGHVDVYGETVLLPIPTDGLVHLFDLEGRAKGTLGAPGSAECQIRFPAAAALDDQGKVIILDQQRALFMTWDLERGVCLSEHYGFGNAPGAFYQPNDLALDRAGRLYVSQGFEGRVQVYEGARPALFSLAARQPPPEISEETLLADADVGRHEAAPAPTAVGEATTVEETAAVEAPAVVEEPPAVAEPSLAVTAEPTPEPTPALPAAEPTPPVVEEAPAVAEPSVAVPAEPTPAPPAAEPATEPTPPAGQPATAAPPPAAEPTQPKTAGVDTSGADASELAVLLVAGARLSVGRAPRYDPTYAEITYPGGDLPPERGGAVDLVVRAFRNAGIDLQQVLQEDFAQAPGAYPIHEPDPSIDHRRIRNLVPLFERQATSLPTGEDADWAPGDVVFWDRDSEGVASHLGILTDETGPSGKLLVVHHHRPTGEFPGTPGEDDVLLRWPVVGHYRWSHATGTEGSAAVEPGVRE